MFAKIFITKLALIADILKICFADWLQSINANLVWPAGRKMWLTGQDERVSVCQSNEMYEVVVPILICLNCEASGQ